MNTITLVSLIAGLILLVAGRKAFWIFLGLAAFAVTVAFIQRYLPNLDERTLLVVSLVVGAIAAAAAVALAKAIVWVGGFVGGGYIGVIVWEMLVPAAAGFPWVAFVIGGVIGMVLMKLLFESLLVLGSSAVGAALFVHIFRVEGTLGLLLLIGLTVIGVIIQGRLWPGKKAEAKKE
jgi:hypothetical protein